MTKLYTASMPDSLDLNSDWTIQFAALDPTTGAAVSGVTVSGASIIAEPVDLTDTAALAVGPFMLVPGPQG